MSSYLVPWSGGLDSTALILRLVNEGHRVEALYTNLNNSAQDARQLKAVQRMHKLYFHKHHVDLNIVEGCSAGVAGGNPILLQQIVYHMFNIIRFVSYHEYVAMGFVMNDDAISFLDDIKTIYNSYNVISNKPLPELVFPLVKVKKHMLYSELPDQLRKYITWCENDGKDKCGVCPSCKRMSEVIQFS